MITTEDLRAGDAELARQREAEAANDKRKADALKEWVPAEEKVRAELVDVEKNFDLVFTELSDLMVHLTGLRLQHKALVRQIIRNGGTVEPVVINRDQLKRLRTFDEVLANFRLNA